MQLLRGDALATYYLANLHYHQEQPVEAERHFQHAKMLFERLQDHYSLARCLLDYARLLKKQRRDREAEKLIHATLKIYRERGMTKKVQQVQNLWKEF